MPVCADDGLPGWTSVSHTERERRTLQWVESDPRFTMGLRAFFGDERPDNVSYFMTIRLGDKWDTLQPFEVVNIAIDDDVIGQAFVAYVRMLKLTEAIGGDFPIGSNIGAKGWMHVQDDLRAVYGDDAVHQQTMITVIFLIPHPFIC